mmetsp:Transcript_4023/g.8602  ORF Transcript_4023/g.8602 Transcript_4023/m.8602 type:complete len:226 (-) Transcript_4023:424-1101(-)
MAAGALSLVSEGMRRNELCCASRRVRSSSCATASRKSDNFCKPGSMAGSMPKSWSTLLLLLSSSPPLPAYVFAAVSVVLSLRSCCFLFTSLSFAPFSSAAFASFARPSRSSHTEVVKKRRSPRSTDTSPLSAPLSQSSQKRSAPSSSALLPYDRCTHQPPDLKITSCLPSKLMIEPDAPLTRSTRVCPLGPTSSSPSALAEASKATTASRRSLAPEDPQSLFLDM